MIKKRAAVAFHAFGRVQGVGFRFFTRDLARKYRITGWVRNLPDGSVEGEAHGTAEQLAQFLSDLKIKHAWARVDRLDSQDLGAVDSPGGFEIL